MFHPSTNSEDDDDDDDVHGRGDDTIYTLHVSLEDIYNGKISKLTISRNILCVRCRGYAILIDFGRKTLIFFWQFKENHREILSKMFGM
jgi:hypothetical protein